jgi:glycogen operon protein
MNMSNRQEVVELPVIKGKTWCLALDTSLPSPQDIAAPEHQQPVTALHYAVAAQTLVVLENKDV